jgi:agmatine/peptidylarginine deiminase
MGVLLVARLSSAGQPIETPSEQSLFYRPTPPLRIGRVATEMEPLQAVFLAMPGGQVLGNFKKEEFFIHLTETIARYAKVVILVNKNDYNARARIEALFRKYATQPQNLRGQVEFFAAQCDTEWIRDYAPVIAFGMDGEPVLLDNMYRDLRSEAQTQRHLELVEDRFGGETVEGPPSSLDIKQSFGKDTSTHSNPPKYLSDFGTFWRRNDDAAPVYFNQWLYFQRYEFARMVRTPIQLWGGDVAFDPEGRLFTSIETLALNGGEAGAFRQWIQEYYSVKEICFLRPLPNSIPHIDLFFKLGESNTILLGQFDEASYSSRFLEDLHREAMRRMEWNTELLRRKCPGAAIVPVPMPPISLSLVAERGSQRDMPASQEKEDPLPKVEVNRYPTVCYRSFLNSLVLRGEGEHVAAVLIPTHSGVEGMQTRVSASYKRAFPFARLHFINCDAMNDEFGGIHCVTAAIPKLRDVSAK